MGYGDHRTFEIVSQRNLERCNVWHPGGIEAWSPTDWGCALAGEAGELCNVLKKLRRIDTGVIGHTDPSEVELLKAAAQEIGDTFLYLDLVAQRLGLDTYDCIRDTFNRVSERESLPQQLGL